MWTLDIDSAIGVAFDLCSAVNSTHFELRIADLVAYYRRADAGAVSGYFAISFFIAY